MGLSEQGCLIGIDGGGSTCRVAIALAGRRFDAEAGAANLTSDSAQALASLNAALGRAAARAGLDAATFADCPAYVGLAGVMAPADATRLAAALPFRRVLVEDDRPAAVAGALGDNDGSVAGLGTGSFLGRQRAGGIRLIGGWGLRLGDEASGAWIGKALLVSILRTVDGMQPASDLTEAVFADFQRDPAEIVAFARDADPAAFARLAPRVTEAAPLGDPVAQAILREGAAYLERGLAALGWQPGEALCLTGGVAGAYAPYLGPAAARSLRPPLGTGLDGALRLAARFAAGLKE